MSKQVFMPGCSLPSYSPEGIAAITAHLKNALPEMGAVQKCCGKPTSAVGQVDLFKERFAMLEDDFNSVGAEEVIVACQNCNLMVNKYAEKQKATSLWALLPKIGLPEELKGKAKDSDIVFTIHDSCSTRYERELQDGIRWIMQELGYKVVEDEYSMENTRCCGFGGMVVPANPDVASRVAQRRVDEMVTKNMVVYCAACRGAMMGAGGKAWHILDLMFGPVIMEGDEPPVNVLASPVKSWINRFKSKKALIKCVSV
jgi:Fe-S oxidoreductase